MSWCCQSQPWWRWQMLLTSNVWMLNASAVLPSNRWQEKNDYQRRVNQLVTLMWREWTYAYWTVLTLLHSKQMPSGGQFCTTIVNKHAALSAVFIQVNVAIHPYLYQYSKAVADIERHNVCGSCWVDLGLDLFAVTAHVAEPIVSRLSRLVPFTPLCIP